MTIAAAAPTSTPAQRRRHWEMLIISSLAIVLSFALFIRPDGRVALRGLGDHPVPETCVAHAVFHIDCPGCGLTRSFICLAQGRLAESWNFNHVGWLMALACLIQVPYRAFSLATNRSLAPRPSTVFGYLLIAALIGNWFVLQVMSRLP
jgi:hypothetical protein